MTTFFRSDVADNVRDSGEFTFNCFSSYSDDGSNFSSSYMRVFVDKLNNLLL